MRFTDFKRHFNGVTGSIGATFEVTKHFNLKFNVARGYRAPNISELASNGEHEGSLRYEIGNSNFKPENSWQADFTLDYANKYIEFQASVFVNQIRNYIYLHRIDSVVEPDLMTFGYAQGNALLWGFEAGFDGHPIHSLHIGANFSYVNARLLNQPLETRWLPLTSAPRLAANVKYEITHNAKVLDNAYIAANVSWYLRQSNYCSLRNGDPDTWIRASGSFGRHRHQDKRQKGLRTALDCRQHNQYLLPGTLEPTEIRRCECCYRLARRVQHGTELCSEGCGANRGKRDVKPENSQFEAFVSPCF